MIFKALKAGITESYNKALAEQIALTEAHTVATNAHTAATQADATATVEQTIAEENSTIGEMADIAATEAHTAATEADILAQKDYVATLAIKAKALGAMITPLGVVLAVTAAAIVAYGAYLDKTTTSVEEAKEQTEEYRQKLESLQSEIDSINSQLETTRDRIADLLSQDEITFTDKQEVINLQNQNEELERELRIKQELQKQASKNASDATTEGFYAQPDNGLFNPHGTKQFFWDKNDDQAVTIYAERNRIDATKEYIGQLTQLKKEISSLEEEQQKYSENDPQYKKISEELEKKQAFANMIDEELTKNITDFQTEDDNLVKGLSTKTDNLIKELDNVYSMYDEFTVNSGSDKNAKINLMFDKNQFKGVKDELVSLGKDGSLSVETLTNKFPLLISMLEDAGVNAQDLYKYIMALVDPDAAIRQGNIDYLKQTYGTIEYGRGNGDEAEKQRIRDWINSLNDDELALMIKCQLDKTTSLRELKDYLAKAQEVVDRNTLSYSMLDGTGIGERLSLIGEQFQNGELNFKDYFDSLNTEIQNVDFTKLTNSLEDANTLGQEFYIDTIQNISNGFADLINSFNNGGMSISEYLESYLSLANTTSSMTDMLQENASAWNENGEAMSDTLNTDLDNAQYSLSNAIEDIQTYQDSIYSLEQMLNNVVDESSDEFHAHALVVAEDLANIVQNGGEMAEQIKNTLGTTTNEIAENMTKSIANQQLAAQAIAANTNSAMGKIAQSVGTLLTEIGNSIKNFKVELNGDWKIGTKTVDILGAQLQIPDLKFELSASGKSLDTIGSAVSSFGQTISDNLAAQQITLPDFYNAGKDEVKDRNYTPSPEITGNYDKNLEGSEKAYDEWVDFFEKRIKKLSDAFELLETNMENVVGAFAKNQLADASIGILDERIKNYEDAANMYQKMADDALNKIPAELQQKVQDGAVALTEFVGEGNEEVVKAIEEYDKWADKVADCTKELAGLKEQIRQLELQKFNNIMQDFTDQFDLRENSKGLIDKQIDLFREAGELVGEAFYTAQIDQTKKQLELLNKEKSELVNSFSSAISSGRIEQGTDEWLEMVKSLKEVDESILDAQKSLETFDNEILALHTEVFERIQGYFGNFNSELDNLIGLLEDADVADGAGVWSAEGLTQLGLLTQKYELAQKQVSDYNDEIGELNKQYVAGKYSATEYADKLAELTQNQWNSINAAEDAKQAIIELNKARIDLEIESIEKEIDEYNKLIDKRREALQQEKDAHDYENSIADHNKNIESLERQLAAMQADTTASSVAKRKKLEEELANARKDLSETQYDHSITVQEEALDKEQERYEEARQAEIDALNESLKNEEALLGASFSAVKQNATLIANQIQMMATEHGVQVSETITSAWKSGENAIASYGEILNAGTSAFIGNLQTVEAETWQLQADANATAGTLAYMFSTRADNLVNELARSYYAEQNLQSMTQALQNSLISTLERGYDVSGITGALNSIKSAADAAAEAVRKVGNSGDIPEKTDTTKYKVVNTYSGKVYADNLNSYAEASDWIDENYDKYSDSPTSMQFLIQKKYAKGVHKLTKDELAWTQEYGNEAILSPTRNAILTPLKSGDTVLTAEQTDNLYKMAKMNPDIIGNMGKISKINPDIIRNATNSNTQNIGSLVTINGDVNDTAHFIKQVADIAGKTVENSWKDFNKSMAYHL